MDSDCPKRGREASDNVLSVAKVTNGIFRRMFTKARNDRGRKKFQWVTALHVDLLEDFERLRKLSMKFAAKKLKFYAKKLIKISQKDSCNIRMTGGKERKPIIQIVNACWTQRFMVKHNIVFRRQTGKLELLPLDQERIEKRVDFSGMHGT